MNITAEEFLDISSQIAIGMISVALLVTLYRLYKGPSLSDRILALDVMVGLGIGFIAVIAIRTEQYIYVDIALAVGLVGFLATIAFARYVLHRGLKEGEAIDDEIPLDAQTKAVNQNDYTYNKEASS